ncbi:MAG TPA: SufD family Fe-S cluster assembly protein [Hyphomonadaceae bacterium]|nr:SufD family Fe-S cluster assembly protein [Hyphomonadaceae bacterium]
MAAASPEVEAAVGHLAQNGSEVSAIAEDRIAEFGLPTRRTEGWRWTPLRRALEDAGPPWVRPDITTGVDFSLEGLLAAFRPSDTVAALALGLADDAWEYGGGAPLQIDSRSRGTGARIVLNPGQAGVVVQHIRKTEHLQTGAALIDLAPGAELSLVLIFEDSSASRIALNRVRLGTGATYRQFVLTEGAKLSRVETEVDIAGAGAKVELSGVYLAAARRHADLTSQVILNAEDAEVRQLVRGVARKGGRGVFQGRFKVERVAQKTDAQMEHNALLLEEGAEIFAKPELEIYADDVQCSHGNTAGQLDENAIFYLRQRGIPEIEARAMITRAFLIEALPDWLDEAVRGEVEQRIDAWLGAA